MQVFVTDKAGAHDMVKRAGADLALTEAVVELVRVLAKIEHDWDGEPEDMIDAHAILSHITLGDDHG